MGVGQISIILQSSESNYEENVEYIQGRHRHNLDGV